MPNIERHTSQHNISNKSNRPRNGSAKRESQKYDYFCCKHDEANHIRKNVTHMLGFISNGLMRECKANIASAKHDCLDGQSR